MSLLSLKMWLLLAGTEWGRTGTSEGLADMACADMADTAVHFDLSVFVSCERMLLDRFFERQYLA